MLQAGFRRYAARPIFSEDNRRSTKHKLERFVQPGRNPSIAAAFGKAQSRLWGERRGVMGHALYARSLPQ